MRFAQARQRTAAVIAAIAFLVGCGGGDSAASSGTQPVSEEIAQILRKPIYRDARWFLRVVNLDNGQVIHELNAGRHTLIGSVRKLFSVGLALEAPGAYHVFHTPVYRRGTVDAAGLLQGNLILVASGDLAMVGRTLPDGSFAFTAASHDEANALGNSQLSTPDPLAGFQQLARQVAASGIREITGEVIIDDRLFEPFDFRGEFQGGPCSSTTT